MIKLVFYGDTLLGPPGGYGEQIADLFALRQPATAFQSFHAGGEALDLQAALQGAPLHVIGKAPDLIYLGLGHADLLRGDAPEGMAVAANNLILLLLSKTRARVAFASVCEVFLPEETREKARAFNANLSRLTQDRVHFLDLNAPIRGFLEKHMAGPGEKRALHRSPLRLTSMGRTLLARAAFDELFNLGLFSA